jgi:hypothetical protein
MVIMIPNLVMDDNTDNIMVIMIPNLVMDDNRYNLISTISFIVTSENGTNKTGKRKAN